MSINTNYQTTETKAPAPDTSVTPRSSASTDFNPGQPSNLNTNGANKTTNFFNNYFTLTDTVSANVNDAIVSFFEEQTGDQKSGKLLAAAVINTATQQKEDPMSVLTEFKKLNQQELNAYLALYLNLSRVNTSLLGVKNVPIANKYIQRTIIK